jgi:macrolide transport system ATP-binding/permease protein
LGVTVVDKLFGNENPIGETVKINRIYFKVIGITPAKGFQGPRDADDNIYIPVTTAMYRVLGKDYLDGIYVEVRDTHLIDEAQAEISQVISKRHRLYKDDEDAFHIRNMSEIQEMLTSTTKTMSLLLGSIAAISLLVGGIGIMNIMLVSVTERTREIGLRKAIGARSGDIMSQFLIESVVMTFTGGLIGILLGAGFALLMSAVVGWATKVSLFSIVLSTTFSIAVGIGFGLWPARKASELNPIEALRYE